MRTFLKSYVLSSALAAALLIPTSSYGAGIGWPQSSGNIMERFHASPVIATLNGEMHKSIIIVSFDDYLYAYRHDGTMRPGFPVKLNYLGGSVSSPAVGDVNGDGEEEIVVLGNDATSPHSIQMVVCQADASSSRFRVTDPEIYYPTARTTPCLIDCIKYGESGAEHPAKEILIRDGMGSVHIVQWNSQSGNFENMAAGYEDLLLTCNSADEACKDLVGSQLMVPSVSASPMPDGTTMMILPSTDGKVYRWNISSSQGSPFQLSAPQFLPLTAAQWSNKFNGSAALADLNGDGIVDVVAGRMDGHVFAWDGSTNQQLQGWPQDLKYPAVSTPIVVDLSASTVQPEIVIGCHDKKVHAFHHNGVRVAGWPKSADGMMYSSVVAGELDGVAGLEVVVGSLDRNIHVWQSNGEVLPGWPKRMETSFYSTPALGDLHGNGRLSLVAGGNDGKLFVFELAPKSLDVDAGWPQFLGGRYRQGHP